MIKKRNFVALTLQAWEVRRSNVAHIGKLAVIIKSENKYDNK